ncbi:unannotated protein [freshwater metagenome]|uniref:Unannotated protein n=1 Tax=freshwater metagenome TaxID=449393 RepID=A0A6J6X0Q1_9ZZZZ
MDERTADIAASCGNLEHVIVLTTFDHDHHGFGIGGLASAGRQPSAPGAGEHWHGIAHGLDPLG